LISQYLKELFIVNLQPVTVTNLSLFLIRLSL
ncbi:MAG: hypothetical protein ACJA1C_003146, partial [Crocinitomicaceae bacterium]